MIERRNGYNNNQGRSGAGWRRGGQASSDHNRGDRRFSSDHRLPADDIGNRKIDESIEDYADDNIGNSIEIEPTHSMSGILASVEGRRLRIRPQPRRNDAHKVVQPAPMSSRIESPRQNVREKVQREEVREAKPRVNNNVASSNWARQKRFYELDEKRGFALKGDPEEKLKEAKTLIGEIFSKVNRVIKIDAKLIGNKKEETAFLVLDEGENRVFGKDDVAILAFNYLVSKIVNPLYDDKIRLIVATKDREEEALRELTQQIKAETKVHELKPENG